MKEFTVNKNEAGQRFDKYLKRLLGRAENSFIYKMLRKKNITLNGKKAEGKEILAEGDLVKLFLSDETFLKFSADSEKSSSEFAYYQSLKLPMLSILYENKDFLIYDKPKNQLSQKAKADDISANEYLIAYMIQNHMLSEEEFVTFHPSVCNRLDRNTTGLLLFGKSKEGLQKISLALKERSAGKYYLAIVKGRIKESSAVKGYLLHIESNNTVVLSDSPREGAAFAHTVFKPLDYNPRLDLTLLEIELITGKTHQIRAHLSSIGHPIIGDYKYGQRAVNDPFKKNYGIDSQLLHSYRIELPQYGTFEAKRPEIFDRLMKD